MESKIRVNFESVEDVGIVTHYRGKPFTGIGYHLYKSGKLANETEMVAGLKHGVSNYYDFEGNLSAKKKYIDDLYHGEQIYFATNGTIIRESYYKKGDFIKVIHFDNNGNKIDGFDWFDVSLNGFNLKIRKFGINGVHSYSPTLIWLEPLSQSVFFYLYTMLMRYGKNSKKIEVKYGDELEFKDPNIFKNLNDLILNFKINRPDDYNQIFHDTSIDDIKELSQYKTILHPSFNADNIPEGTPPNQLFKQQYLKINKGHNKDYKQWLVLDYSVKPIGIVFQSNLKSDCENWIDGWD
tara:strand:- start:4986 stop:5870 length:885 start_codon:yes stop_codon:yes gene_type:complete